MGVQIAKHVEIIQKQFHEHSKIFLDSFTYCQLISWWNIFEPEWHDHPNKGSLIGDECNLVPIFKGDHDLMIIENSSKNE